MEFSELTFRLLEDPSNKAQYCIDWAEHLLENGCENLTVAELAIFGLESNYSQQEVDRIFHRCIAELGLELLDNWNEALIKHIATLCKSLLQENITSLELLNKILILSNELDDPGILWPWIYLAADTEFKSDSIAVCVDASDFNSPLDTKNPNKCIFEMASQFHSLGSINLPASFPDIWWCQSCGAISEASQPIQIMQTDCQICHSPQAMKNMQYFVNRELLIKNTWPVRTQQ